MGVGGWVVGGLVARWALGGTWKGRCAGGEVVGTTGCMVVEKTTDGETGDGDGGTGGAGAARFKSCDSCTRAFFVVSPYLRLGRVWLGS